MEVSQPNDHITHAVIGGGKTIDFGISDSAEFFDILSKTLYTDQILAVVREVLCNAWDAHIEAGCTDKPIQIKIDSDHFTVRDFGFGIRHDLIKPIYGIYGASTKKNDGKQTGGFGLGCKAPFAYTDHFEVTSSHLGTRTIYNMSKSNAVAKGKPGIIPIASFPTIESGLQVKMPIQGKDWRRFQSLIERIVSNGEMNAELNGKLLPTIPFSQAKHGYLMTTDEVMDSAYNDKRILLRYGNVIYPVETNEELGKLFDTVTKVMTRFSGYTLILQAPPDSISVTPSRESLSMQDHTVATLRMLFKSFLGNVKGLEEEILVQGKAIIDAAVTDKDYYTIFSQSWGYKNRLSPSDSRITDLVGMARYQLTQDYPKNVEFRLKDVDYRIRKAVEIKMLDTHLASTFLKELPSVKTLPERYYYTDRKNASDWLHRQVIGKVMVKLRDSGMDDTALFVLDQTQYTHKSAYDPNHMIPARQACRRNHLNNMPFLRKTIVLTTAVGQLRDRIRAYGRNHPESPQDGMLCYHIRNRKVDNVAATIALFTKLGYEIIDLTKRHSWEVSYDHTPVPRKKAEPYSGLPALSTISDRGGINVSAFREEAAVRLPLPELVTVIGLRNGSTSCIDGFTTLATKGLVKLYGQRLGIAKDKIEFNRAVKHGAVDFMPVLEAEMEAMFRNSPNIAEYLAYDYTRVWQAIPSYGSNGEALRAVYKDKDLRLDFGLKNNLTSEEAAMVNVFNHSTGLSNDCRTAIKTYIDTIPLGPENAVAVAAVTGNEILAMLDISRVRAGLNTPKRQLYLDVFLKVLKG